ncbi:MAG: undecaprenyl/decaprenyl-phosphate alpha-N-acetylglucosaminyl 1-phosphate transferase [Acidobacteria bacterium]|nr:undecaprenyl/decaprenyl-phosphate alpha-N-acetylglucosaminyl 1-phosphate transferase [Acidobacteriota bacterium]
MNTYLTLFLISLFASLFATPVVRRLAQRFGWLDVPADDRRVHALPTPRLGGVAVFGSVMLALLLLPFVDNLVTQQLALQWQGVVAVLASSTLVFLFGVFDDLSGASAKWKFVAQGAAAVLLYALGGRVEAVTVPFVGSFALPPVLSFGVTLVWVVGISNAFNLIDGLDGLAAGASLFAALVMLGVSLVNGHTLVTVLSIALVGALIGFLRYNFNPASIFLGDSGSLFIGFLLAALSVTGTQKASTVVAVAIPIMAFALPVIDTGFAMTRRFISGKPLFEGDREHIHHKLLERGWSQRRVAFVLYGVCAFFGLLALLFTSDGGQGKLTGLILLITGAAIVLTAGRLRYHEVDEVRAGLRRNFGERKIRTANHVRVRRASHSLSKANTLGEVFTAVRDVLELGEFVYATVQLGRGGDLATGEKVLALEEGDRRVRGAEVRGGLICWEWERGDVEAAEVQSSHFFWTLRLPLSTDTAGWGYIHLYREFGGDGLLMDVNYLSNLFQKELALAAERVFKRVTTEDANDSSLVVNLGR